MINTNPQRSMQFFTNLTISSSLADLKKHLCAEIPPVFSAKGLIKMLSVSPYLVSLYMYAWLLNSAAVH